MSRAVAKSTPISPAEAVKHTEIGFTAPFHRTSLPHDGRRRPFRTSCSPGYRACTRPDLSALFAFSARSLRRSAISLRRALEARVHENDISAVVLDAAIEVHRALGPGLLESVYEVALAHVLRQRGLALARQVPISITFQGITFDEGFRADLIVQNLVLIELKSLERVAPVHRKVVLTYLRLSRLRLGLLIHFGAPVLKDGFERLVNGLDEQDRAENAKSAERPSNGQAPR